MHGIQKADKICWFAARTRNGQWKKNSRRLGELGVECFVPESYNTLLFLHTGKARALSLVNSGEISARFMIDHGTGTLLEVPAKQMEDFIRVLNEMPEARYTSEFTFAKGDHVKVVSGPLKGVEGDIVETEEGTFLTVRVLSLLCALVKIPRGYVVPAHE